jgi:hypothetical protein
MCLTVLALQGVLVVVVSPEVTIQLTSKLIRELYDLLPGLFIVIVGDGWGAVRMTSKVIQYGGRHVIEELDCL